MKRLLAFLLIFTLVPLSCASAPTIDVDRYVARSVVRLVGIATDDHSVVVTCSAWSLGNKRFLTAAHCAPTAVTDQHGPGLFMTHEIDLQVNGVPAKRIKVDEVKDLALLEADLKLPALRFRNRSVEFGEEVAGMGYAYGFTFPLVTKNEVAAVSYSVQPDAHPGIVFVGKFGTGMSGGPVYDEYGNVVSIIQRSYDLIGYGVDVKTIKDFLRVDKPSPTDVK